MKFDIGSLDLLVAFDTEYVNSAPFNAELSETDNQLVSMQFIAHAPNNGREAAGVMMFPIAETKRAARKHKGRRLSLSAMLGRIIHGAAKAGLFPNGLPEDRKIRIAIVAHFNRADISMFSDARPLFRSIDMVQGSLISIGTPVIRQPYVNHHQRATIAVSFLDTRAVAPDGAKSLAALGDALKFNKLKVPEVITENGEVIEGISRMDLVALQHSDEFNKYALRDCAVALKWLLAVDRFAKDWGLEITPRTIASLGVAKFRDMNADILPEFLGRKVKPRGGIANEFIDEFKDHIPLCADTYFGGRNESFVNGIWTAHADRPFTDYDFKSAYGCGQAFLRIPNYAGAYVTKKIEQLAQLDCMSFARVRFRHPDDCLFPAGPVDTASENLGLLFPLEGETAVNGFELCAMIDAGADIEVISGLVIPWLDPNGLRPVVLMATDVNRVRASFPKKHPFELLAKTALNGLYGKFSQSVAGMKSTPHVRQHFDTRSGEMMPLPWSGITNPALASYISGIPRSALSECLHRLSTRYPHVRILSATTDGLLCDATREEIDGATDGRIGRALKKLRALIDPNGCDDIIEVKHRAHSVLQIKTRGQLSLEPLPLEGGGKAVPILAKAGHKLADDFDTMEKQAAELARLHRYRDRADMSFIDQNRFLSFRDQWETGGDLVKVTQRVATNLEFDHKRRLVDPIDHGGLIKFTTVPHRNLGEFLKFRKSADRHRQNGGRPLMRTADLADLYAYQQRPNAAGRRSPFQHRLVVGLAQGLLPGLIVTTGSGRPKREGNTVTLAEIADRLSLAGITGLTGEGLRSLRRREQYPTATPILTKADHEIIARLRRLFPDETIASAIGNEATAATIFATTQSASNGNSNIWDDTNIDYIETNQAEDCLILANENGLQTGEKCFISPPNKCGQSSPDDHNKLETNDISLRFDNGYCEQKSGQNYRGGEKIRPLLQEVGASNFSSLQNPAKSPLDARRLDKLLHCELGLTPAMLARGRRKAAADKTLDAVRKDFQSLVFALAEKDGIPVDLAHERLARVVLVAMAEAG